MRTQHTSAHLCALAALLLAAAVAAQGPVTPARLSGAGPNAASQGVPAAALVPPANAQAAALATYPPIRSDASVQPRAVAFAPGDSQARESASFVYIKIATKSRAAHSGCATCAGTPVCAAGAGQRRRWASRPQHRACGGHLRRAGASAAAVSELQPLPAWRSVPSNLSARCCTPAAPNFAPISNGARRRRPHLLLG